MSEPKDILLEQEAVVVEAGVHHFSKEEEWIRPEEPLLNERLEWFKDQKLGLMMHWGPYSQLGLVESWALSDDDGDWSRHDVDWTDDMEHFKREYCDLNKTFNPIRFQPEVWADLAADNGFKYFCSRRSIMTASACGTHIRRIIALRERTRRFISINTPIFAVRCLMPSALGGWASRLIFPKRTGIRLITGRRAWSADIICGAGLLMIQSSILGCGRNS